MESLIESGMVTGVLDITTTEWADELVGGMLGAGPTRLEAAARKGVPAIVTPGCLDMVNFGSPESIPTKFSGRNLYQHNPQVTLMRTTISTSRAFIPPVRSSVRPQRPRRRWHEARVTTPRTHGYRRFDAVGKSTVPSPSSPCSTTPSRNYHNAYGMSTSHGGASASS